MKCVLLDSAVLCKIHVIYIVHNPLCFNMAYVTSEMYGLLYILCI